MTPEPELEELIYEYLAEENPEALGNLSDQQVQARIRVGIRRARAHKLDTDGSAVAFVSLMFLVAPDFDRHAGIRRALENVALPADERIKALFTATTEDDWAEAAAGSAGWDDQAEPS